MRKSSPYLFVAAVAMLAAGMLAVVSSRSSAEENAQSTATVGQPAPQFALQDQNGKTVNLGDYAGKVVVLEWFNPQCPFVVKFYEKSGKMNDLANAYADKGVVWLTINSGADATNATNQQIAAEWGIDRPMLNDSEQAVAKAYGATNTPHMYVIDKDGNLAYMGAIDSVASTDASDIAGAENYVSKALDEVLAGTNVTTPQTKAYGCSVKYAQ
jgi:peroxiredoxin